MERRVFGIVLLAGVVGFAAGLVVGRGSPPKQQPISLSPGTPITVTRPTGEVITNQDGKNPTPKTETTQLAVYRVQNGKHNAPPAGRGVWLVTIGDGPTVYAAEK